MGKDGAEKLCETGKAAPPSAPPASPCWQSPPTQKALGQPALSFSSRGGPHTQQPQYLFLIHTRTKIPRPHAYPCAISRCQSPSPNTLDPETATAPARHLPPLTAPSQTALPIQQRAFLSPSLPCNFKTRLEIPESDQIIINLDQMIECCNFTAQGLEGKRSWEGVLQPSQYSGLWESPIRATRSSGSQPRL